MSDRSVSTSVLVVEDEPTFRQALQRYLTALGCEVHPAGDVAEGREILERTAVDVALVDFELPDGTGADLVRWAMARNRAEVAYCITGVATCRNVVELMRAGCADVLEKPLSLDRLAPLIASRRPVDQAELLEWRRRITPELIGDDPELIEQLRIVRNVAETDCTVLVHGESGTGKELIARAVHTGSLRRNKPFVALNCAAIPESLIEAELFGHTRGAFTGAVAAREGSIAAANGGTLFLDEIGDMPLAAQAKLLRVLQERTVTPIGADRSMPIDVRIVAATNRSLEEMVEEGTFRPDLYFRLSVIRVTLPTLRDRVSDILPLARYFLTVSNQRMRRAVTGFDPSAETALRHYFWPGNVRELANTIERAVLLRGEGRLIEKDLQLPVKTNRMRSNAGVAAATPAQQFQQNQQAMQNMQGAAPGSPAPMSTDDLNLKNALNGIERALIQQALERTGGNRAEAAALLGLNRTTLVEKIRKHTG